MHRLPPSSSPVMQDQYQSCIMTMSNCAGSATAKQARSGSAFSVNHAKCKVALVKQAPVESVSCTFIRARHLLRATDELWEKYGLIAPLGLPGRRVANCTM